jgi:hypothetical protein
VKPPETCVAILANAYLVIVSAANLTFIHFCVLMQLVAITPNEDGCSATRVTSMGEVEKGKLKTLLNYWIEHNREHAQEFREWAEKAKSFGQAEVHDNVMRAVQQMNKANESLLSALERLKEE